jgi:hypothetical protein
MRFYAGGREPYRVIDSHLELTLSRLYVADLPRIAMMRNRTMRRTMPAKMMMAPAKITWGPRTTIRNKERAYSKGWNPTR